MRRSRRCGWRVLSVLQPCWPPCCWPCCKDHAMPASPFAPCPLPPAQLDSLYSAHRGWLAHWLQRRLGNAFDAADLAQDTFARLLASPAQPQTPALRSPKAYLATVAKHLLINHLRRRSPTCPNSTRHLPGSRLKSCRRCKRSTPCSMASNPKCVPSSSWRRSRDIPMQTSPPSWA